MESSGKSRRYGSPVSGLADAGPVLPLQLPSALTQTTNQRSVSMYLPGPTIASHQPGDGSASLDAACALGERPVWIRIAFDFSPSSVPQVSYASVAPTSAPPRFIANGEGRSK